MSTQMVEPSQFTCQDAKVWRVGKVLHLTHGHRTYCRVGSIIPLTASLLPAKGKRKPMQVCSDCLAVAKIRGEFND